MQPSRERFAALIHAGARCELDRAALEIARIAYPELDPAPHLACLDGWAAALRTRIAPATAPHEAAAAVARYLFDDLGFRGNTDDFYDPRNSFLNDVLDRRTGIPITLSVLLMSVARRLDLPVHGVAFPGHFLTRIDTPTGPLILDPFNGGRPLDREELLRRLRAVAASGGGHPGSNLQRVLAQALQAANDPTILARMLGNLLSIYLERDDAHAALTTVDLLLVASPDAAEPTRLRGLLYERLECWASALDDLRRYLDLAPEGPFAADVRARVIALEGRGSLH